MISGLSYKKVKKRRQSLVAPKKVITFAFESKRYHMHRITDVEKYLSYLVADKGYSDKTALAYRTSLREFVDFINLQPEPPADWGDIDRDLIRRHIAAEMKRGLTPPGIARKLSALRGFFRYLMLTGRIDGNPARCIRNPRRGRPLPVFLKESEMNRLFDEVHFPDSFTGRRDRTILMLFYHCGLRLSELVGLDRSGLHLAEAEIKVLGKRNKERIVPFGKEMSHEFRAYLVARQAAGLAACVPLFVEPDGRRMKPPKVRNMVKGYLALVTNQQKKSPHVLRHTFATAMLNNGADLEAIKQLLGHAGIGTTEVYTHTTFAELKKEYQLAHPRA